MRRKFCYRCCFDYVSQSFLKINRWKLISEPQRCGFLWNRSSALCVYTYMCIYVKYINFYYFSVIHIFESPPHSISLIQTNSSDMWWTSATISGSRMCYTMPQISSNVCPICPWKQKEKKYYIKSIEIKAEKLTENALYCDKKTSRT